MYINLKLCPRDDTAEDETGILRKTDTQISCCVEILLHYLKSQLIKIPSQQFFSLDHFSLLFRTK